MSMFFINENYELMSFGKYLLSESIKPTETSYGIDKRFINKEWIESGSVRYTFIKHDERYYFIAMDISDGEIMFGTSDYFDITKIHSLWHIKNTFNAKRRHDTQRVLYLYGKLFYVFLEGIKKYNLEKIKFSAQDPTLGTAYSKIFNNEFILNYLKKEGYVFKGKENEDFVFVKI